MRTSAIALAAAALVLEAKASYVILTDFEIPTFTNTAEAAKWTSSVQKVAQDGYGKWYQTQTEVSDFSSFLNQASAIENNLVSFYATATYDIPPAVTATDAGSFTIYTEVPDWYSALPKDSREFVDQQVSRYASIVKQALQTSTGGSASPSATPSAGATQSPGPESTGSAENTPTTPSGSGTPAAETGAAVKVTGGIGAGLLAAVAMGAGLL